MSGSGDLRFSVSLDDLPEVEDEKKPAAGWDHVGGRLSVLPGEIEVEHAAPEAEPNIEIVHVRDGGRGNHEIEELQQKYEAEKAQRERAEQVASAEQQHRMQRERWTSFRIIRTPSPKSTTRNWRNLRQAQWSSVAAQNAYDHEAAAVAAAQIAVYAQRAEECHRALNGIEEQANEARQRLSQPQQPQPVSGDPVEHWIATAGTGLPEADKNYLRERKEFIQAHPDNPEILISAARIAEKRYGLTPGSPEYHEFLDSQIGLADADESPAPRQGKQKSGRRMVAAPSSRSTGRSPGGAVHLNDFDLATCKELGISPRDYARQYKTNANKGQTDKSVTGGRLHASYSVNTYEDHF